MKNHFQTFAVSFHLILFHFSPFFPLFFTLLAFADQVRCSFLLTWYTTTFLWMFSLLTDPVPWHRAWFLGHSAPYSAEGKPFPTALFLIHEDQTSGTATLRLSCSGSWEWGNFPAVQPSECLWGHRAYTLPVCMHRGDDLKFPVTVIELVNVNWQNAKNIIMETSASRVACGKTSHEKEKSSPPHLEIWMKC